MPLHHVVQRRGVTATGAEISEALFGEVGIFEIVEVFYNCFPCVEALASSCELGQGIETLFDFRGKAQGGPSGNSGFGCYTCIANPSAPPTNQSK